MKTRNFAAVLIFILIGTLVYVSAFDRRAHLGIRAGLNMNKLYIEESQPTDADMREGFSIGLTLKVPVTSLFSLVPEMNYSYRVLGSYKIEIPYFSAAGKYVVSEMSISVPVMIHFVPFENIPFYIAAGVQVDLPLNNKLEITFEGESVSESIEKAYSLDFGVPLGFGCMAATNVYIDFRFFNFDYMFYRYDFGRNTFWSFGFGVTYFFTKI